MIAILGALAVAGGTVTFLAILATVRGPRSLAAATTAGTVGESAATPAVRRSASDTLTAVAPKGYLAVLERQILLAGRPSSWTVGRILVGKVLLGGVATLLAAAWIAAEPAPVRILLGLFLIALGFFTPDLLIYSRAIERREQIQLSLPDTLDQMTIAVEAGLGFEAAMTKAAANGSGPLAEELGRTVQDMSIGRSRRDAYQALADRTSSADLRRFTRAVLQADVYGIAIADVLRVQAGEMRLKRRQRAEQNAMKVPVKVLFPLVFCILPVLFIVLLTPAVLSVMATFG